MPPCGGVQQVVVVDVLTTLRLWQESHRDFFVGGNEAGMLLAGTSPDGKLVEVVEIPDHPWFVAVQFHPEFKSKPLTPHPLFRGFVAAALQRHHERVQTVSRSETE